MDGLLTEQEQIEAMRGWWRENGRYIISGLVIGAGLLFGWNYWTGQQEQKALEASILYERLLDDVAETRLDPGRTKATEIVDRYASTVYAPQARLAMARLYMDLGRDRDAAEELRPVVEQGEDSGTALLARLRLAKVLLYQDNPEEAVALLQGYGGTAFAARYSEAMGDAYVALDRSEDAVEAYAGALNDNPNAPTIDRTLVQMKMNDVRTAPAIGEDVPEGESMIEGEGGRAESTVPEAGQ